MERRKQRVLTKACKAEAGCDGAWFHREVMCGGVEKEAARKRYERRSDLNLRASN
jgi:hypothetical protein